MEYDLVIIGAGVSGCFAAINANKNIKILIVDSNNDILKKFMITGKGKSNITNTLPINMFLDNLIDSNKFLYPSLMKFNSNNIIEFLKNNNIKFHEKTTNRIHLIDENIVFKNKIKEILNSNKNINLLLNTKIDSMSKIGDKYILKSNDKEFISKNVIVATGGLSYKNLGCDGSGYELLKKTGHKIIDQYPIGVGFITKDKFNELQGISLENIKVSIFDGNKKIYSETGDLIFTHYGVGGPVIRRVSGYVSKLIKDKKKYKIIIEWLDKKIIENNLETNKKLSNCFKSFNKKVRNFLLHDIDINTDLKNMKKNLKEKIISILSNYELEVIDTQNIDLAINTGGGVSLKEINPNSFESKINKNLYVIGEILDLNPRTNGFNITVCYSTALTCINEINKKYSSQ